MLLQFLQRNAMRRSVSGSYTLQPSKKTRYSKTFLLTPSSTSSVRVLQRTTPQRRPGPPFASPVSFRPRATAFRQQCFANTSVIGSRMLVSSTIACSCKFRQLAEAARRCFSAVTTTSSKVISAPNAFSSLCPGSTTYSVWHAR